MLVLDDMIIWKILMLRWIYRAKKAADSGLFDAEIVPVTTKVKDDSGQEKTVTVSNPVCIELRV